ncbi:MAG: hypothetical protein IJV80_06165 [Clostridia bacterium]|nr:hypothetical protein [Clostridia bacterium]
METFAIECPLENEYFTTVRLTTGGVCSLAGLDVDISEDCKVCVTESLLILKRNGYARAKIEYAIEKGLSCKVCGVGTAQKAEDSVEDEISRALLSALVNEVEYVENECGKVKQIAFKTE